MNWNRIATFLDTDGSVFQDKDTKAIIVKWTNTNRKSLKEIQDFVKVGRIYEYQSPNPRHKKRFDLIVIRVWDVVGILEKTAPYLSIKKRKAEEFLRILKSKPHYKVLYWREHRKELLRLKRKMTYTDLSRKLGISRRSLSRIIANVDSYGRKL